MKSAVSSSGASSTRIAAVRGPSGKVLDPAQHVAQDTAQTVDIEAERPPLRGQLEDHFVLVIGHAVFQRGDLGVGREHGFQPLGGRLERFGIGAGDPDIQRIAARTGPPAAEADRFHHGVPRDRLFQIGQKLEGRVGSEIGIDQFDRDGAQLLAVLAVSARKTATRRAAGLGQDIGHRVAPVLGLVLRRHLVDAGLQLSHLRQRILARGPRRHREVARDRALFGGIEEAPRDVALNEQGGLAGQQGHGPREDRIPRTDHPGHRRAEQVIAHPAEALVDLP